MTLHRIRTTRDRAQRQAEQRMALAGLNPNGYQLMDPSAIPPHGYDHLSRAGVLVTPHALALDTPVLTTAGWKTIGTVQVGDYVYAEDGTPTRVSHVSPIFNKPCHQLTFADGSTITATGDHLWRVWDAYGHISLRREGRAWKTLSTNELIDGDSTASIASKARYRVRCDAIVETPDAELPIDPYVFGYWLGDGHNRQPSITAGHEDVQHIRDEFTKAGCRIVSEREKTSAYGSGVDIRFAIDAKHMDGIESRLKRLGVLGNKHVPEVYMLASASQRRALLAGLLDSDGHCTTQPTVRFSSVLEPLAVAVHHLARSLGQRATLRRLPDGMYEVGWTPTFDPFRIARKSARARLARPGSFRRLDLMSIEAIEPVKQVPTRCITVEHESHVFLVGETFVPTHNSLLQVDIVYTALRIISNNIIYMRNLRAYKHAWDNKIQCEYRVPLKTQPPILTNTFGGATLGGLAGTMMQCTGRDRTIWSMGLFGEAFWYILLRNRDGSPQTIEVLHPAFMEVKAKDGQITYVYGSGSNKQELDPFNVIHIPGKSLPAARRAMAPSDYAGVAGALAIAAYEFGSAWFSQGSAPSMILSTDQKLGKDEVDRIAAKYQVEHSGLGNAHRVLVLDSGIQAEKTMSSPDEAQYLNTLEYSRQVLGQWWGIPASKMPNALQKQNAPMPHARQEDQISFEIDTLSTYTVPLEEVHSALVPDPDVFAMFETDRLNEPDAQFRAMEIQALRTTQVAAINDLRVRRLGWAPLPDPQAYDALAPLASNTAPSQTGNQGMFPDGPEPQPSAAGDEK